MTTFNGTATDDTLPLAGADNSGDDVLYGWGGNDILYGGLGEDILIGEMGNDLLVGGAGVDNLYGGSGLDTASYADVGGMVAVDLALGEAWITDDITCGSQLADRLYECRERHRFGAFGSSAGQRRGQQLGRRCGR